MEHKPVCDIPPIDEGLELSREWYDRSRAEFRKDLNPQFQGPLTESNWLIYGILLVGAYPAPASFNPHAADSYLEQLLSIGIDTFVCLNDEYGKNPEHYAYAEDEGDPKLYGSRGLPALSAGKFVKDRDFINMPVKDMNIGDPTKIIDLCEDLVKRICEGKHVYIHCTGGHGRTGTIASILLCLLYGITADESLEYVQYAHDQRQTTYGNQMYSHAIVERDLKSKFTVGQVPTPQTSPQREQVKSIVSLLQQRPPLIRQNAWSDLKEAEKVGGRRTKRKKYKKRKQSRRRKSKQRKNRY